MRRGRGEDEEDGASGHRQLTLALHRLITAETLETRRAVICEAVGSFSRADAVLLFEVDDTGAPSSLELTSSLGTQNSSIDPHNVSRRLAVEAARSGFAHSSLDRFPDAELDRLAEQWRRGGRLCLSYPLRRQDELAGALALVCLGRSMLEERELWALRRFYQAAAAALLDARGKLRLSELARTDPLTGVANRIGLERALEQAGSACGVLMVDFDDLKQLNEKTDYMVGDQVLIAIGCALGAETRPGETAGRLGGDEFMLVVPRAGLEQLEQRARALSERLDRLEVLPAAQPFYRGASVGFAIVERGEAPDNAIRRASEQMRSQKRRRKTDRIVSVNPPPRDDEASADR